MRARFAAAAVLTAVLALAGCGVPTGGQPDTIPSSQVPFGLASPASNSPPATSAPVQVGQPRIYLVRPDDAVLPVAREVPEGTVRERLNILLKYLATGPTNTEKRHGISTALPPDVVLTVRDLTDERATIDISGTSDAPSGNGSRRAVGQIVLTATSLADVHQVLLTSNGAPIEAPLPSGELTSQPLTGSDYSVLLRPPTPTPTAATPSASPASAAPAQVPSASVSASPTS